MRKEQPLLQEERSKECRSFDERILIPESVQRDSRSAWTAERNLLGDVATASRGSNSPWPRYMSLTGAHGCAPICERGVLPCTVDGESGSSWSWLVDLPERWTAEDGRTDDSWS